MGVGLDRSLGWRGASRMSSVPLERLRSTSFARVMAAG